MPRPVIRLAAAGLALAAAAAQAQPSPPAANGAPIRGGRSSHAQASRPQASRAQTTRSQTSRTHSSEPRPAVLVLPWSDAAVFAVAATPGRVTDIVLEPGEQLAGSDPVAAGDTARWIIGETESGVGAGRRIHILVKPTAAGLSTNLIAATDRRTYHLELRATTSAYAAQVSWRYPAGELVALKIRKTATDAVATAPAAPAATAPPPPPIERINFGWRIKGQAPWRPERVFDDGQHVVIEFPQGAAMPPLFECAPGGALQLINYRIVGRRMVVDRLFTDGELRLGQGKAMVRVELSRTGR